MNDDDYIAIPMKNTIYLFAVAILVSVGGCKKQEPTNPCVGIYCDNGGTCIDGHCVCINDFTGEFCRIAPDSCLHINCGTHGYCSHGHCDCNANWTGANCDTQIAPIDSFMGNYQMVGISQYVSVDSTGPVVPINDTAVITKFNDITLQMNAYDLQYEEYLGDAVNYYNYLWLSDIPNNLILIRFKKTLNDSVHYASQNGNTYIVLNGRKIQ